jgi:hypothetical protein
MKLDSIERNLLRPCALSKYIAIGCETAGDGVLSILTR